MAIAKWYNNASEGTWIIKGTFGDSRLIRDSGNYLRAVSGEGTIVVAFNRDETKVYANGALQYSTAPPLTSVTGGGIVVCEEGLSEIANVQFIPRMYDNAEAIANATSDVAITLDWIFVDDSSIVTKFDEKEYGVRSLTDGGDVIRSQNLKDAFTFTRSSTGTYIGADGLIKTAAVDEPRYDHDPITGESLGILIEESRTNLLTGSSTNTRPEGLSTWATSIINVTGAVDFLPAGHNWTEFVGEASGNTSFYYNDAYNTIGINALTLSVWVREDSTMSVSTGPYMRLRGNTSLIAAEKTLSGTDLTNGPVRVSVTIDCSGDDSVNIRFGGLITSNFIGTVAMAGWQLEEGYTASSYIPTTTAAVTRAADNMSRTLGDEFNNNAFSGVITFNGKIQVSLANAHYLSLATSAGSAGTPRVSNRVDNSQNYNVQIVSDAGSLWANPSYGSYLTDGENTVAYSVDVSAGTAIVAVNGTVILASTGNSGSFNNITTAWVSSSNTVTSKSVRGWTTYPYALTEAELVELTS